MQRRATHKASLEMAMNSFTMYPRFSDPCRAHIHLMGLTGLQEPREEGSEVTDRRGPEVLHQDVRVLRLTGAE